MRILILLATVLLSGLSAVAQTKSTYHQVTGEDLRAVFADAMILSEYRSFKGINKKSYDFKEYHFADGTTDYTEKGSKTEKGRWDIIGDDKICYKYPTTQAFPQTYCFFVFRQGKCYYQYGVSEMTIYGPRSYDLWVSRFVRKGDGGVCGEAIS